MTGGEWGVAMGPAEEIQPPFASSSWFVRIQRQLSLLAVTTLTCRPIKTKRFRRNITYAISDVPTKAIGLINLRRCRCCCQWFDMGVFLFGESVGIVMVVSTTSGWSTSLFGWRSDHGGFSGLVTEIPPPLDWTPYHCVTMMWRRKDATKYGWFDCRLTCTLCALSKITTVDVAPFSKIDNCSVIVENGRTRSLVVVENVDRESWNRPSNFERIARRFRKCRSISFS